MVSIQNFATLLTAAIAIVHAAPLQSRQSDNFMLNGLEGSMSNAQQVFDEIANELKTGSGHAGAEIVTAAITGLDSQIDNAIATVSQALAPLTGGISMAIGNAILGPFFQSVTNGAEVVLGNLIGGAFDLVADPVVAAFTGNLGNLANEAKKYNIDTTKLLDITHQIENTNPKAH
jgi:hypothetical protein